MSEGALTDKEYLLEKIPGKGGWTYARLPEISSDKKNPFGWRKVKGTIDGYAISKYNLMPMGEGVLFLPVKAEIRKMIGKQAGDYVHVVLYPDHEPLETPAEFLDCLKEEPKALRFFKTLNESERKFYIQWIYSAKREETKINRLAKAINRLALSLKYHDAAKPGEFEE